MINGKLAKCLFIVWFQFYFPQFRLLSDWQREQVSQINFVFFKWKLFYDTNIPGRRVRGRHLRGWRKKTTTYPLIRLSGDFHVFGNLLSI